MKNYALVIGLSILVPFYASAMIPLGDYTCHTHDSIYGKYSSRLTIDDADAARRHNNVLSLVWTFNNNETAKATGIVRNNDISIVSSYYSPEDKETYYSVLALKYDTTKKTLAGPFTRLNSKKTTGIESCEYTLKARSLK
jgi:hypothetical protein